MGKAQEPEVRASLQETLLRLMRFWTDEGCLWLPSCDFEVEAGTLHPDSFFRLLGPEPWRAVFLQPVRRPLDGRRREHPYRLQKHLQLQVVLKPPPPDLQTLYLRSLETLGCELAVHDLRFAEWNWQSTALDAWGSGWHVLVDGLGITRLTFLQEAAGTTLEPPTAELSYGIERLTMLLAGKPSAGDLEWVEGGPVYGDLRRTDEAELSRYVFAVADVGALRRQLEELLGESDRCLEAGLVRPAYELAVKSLQGVDILEARGDLTTFERQRWLAEVKSRVQAAAALYLEAREPRSEAGGEDRVPEQDPGKEPVAEPPKADKGKTKKAAKARRRRQQEPADGG
ncbi:MAG: glycine--tRNA ligase subunit alpha [Thermoanaerobaculia bacterium]